MFCLDESSLGIYLLSEYVTGAYHPLDPSLSDP